LSGTQQRIRAGTSPQWITSLRKPDGHVSATDPTFYPLMGFRRQPSMLSRRRRPFSVLMGLMPGRFDRFVADRIGSLSEVLHRP
jgi:hypothetical protein